MRSGEETAVNVPSDPLPPVFIGVRHFGYRSIACELDLSNGGAVRRQGDDHRHWQMVVFFHRRAAVMILAAAAIDYQLLDL